MKIRLSADSLYMVAALVLAAGLLAGLIRSDAQRAALAVPPTAGYRGRVVRDISANFNSTTIFFEDGGSLRLWSTKAMRWDEIPAPEADRHR